MGTMKLIATNCIEEEIPSDGFPPVQKIKYRSISVEDLEEMKRQIKAHENDPPIKFYDYVGLMQVPIKPIPKSLAEQYEKIASKYGKKIEGINYDDCCTG